MSFNSMLSISGGACDKSHDVTWGDIGSPAYLLHLYTGGVCQDLQIVQYQLFDLVKILSAVLIVNLTAHIRMKGKVRSKIFKIFCNI